MSKTTQRRAVVAGLSFVLGAAGTLPALAASEGGTPDAAPSYIDSLADLPFVSYLPGQELADDADAVVDEAGEFVQEGGGLAGNLPIVGPLLAGLPIVGGGGGAGGLAGSLPIVGPMVSSLPLVGGGAHTMEGGGLAGSLPIVGPLVAGLPIVGGGGSGLLGGLLGGAGGLLGGSFL